MDHQHISDIELLTFLNSPDVLHADRQAAVERAIGECPVCQTTLEFLSVFDLDEDVDSESGIEGEGAAAARANFERIAIEDRDAELLLSQNNLLAAPARAIWNGIEQQRPFRSGGVVRTLLRRANEIYEQQPLDALTLADAAISVAEALPDDTYPWNSIFELRGSAWKERANALLVLGRYPAALDALVSAERAYGHLQSSGFGLSATALIRASVLYEQEHYSDALTWAQRAEHGFAHLGQDERRMRAVFLRAAIKYELHDYDGAVSLFAQTADFGERSGLPRWIARAAYAIANCEIDRGHLSEATLQLHTALPIFREIGPERDRIATEHALARVVLHSGKPLDAVEKFRRVAKEYEKLEMASDAALVQIDVIEALLAVNRTREVTLTAARLVKVFRAAGMSRSALTAIAFMRDAHSRGSLTPEIVGTVRRFLRRAESHPELAFTPPPHTFR